MAGRVMRVVLLCAGTLCLVLAAIGVVVPLLPTTPFVLLAAACYLRGSERCYHWMMRQRVFGEPLRRYYAGEGITPATKAWAITLLWVTLGTTILFVAPRHPWWVTALLAGAGIGVTISLLFHKTGSSR